MKRSIYILSINLLILIFLSEILWSVVYYVREGEAFYFRNSDSYDDDLEGAAKLQVNAKLHPYWGYVPQKTTLRNYLPRERLDRLYGKSLIPEWIDVGVNEYGFFTEYTYPYVPLKNEFVVGVFGGSVAHWFSLQARQSFISKLAESPALKDKKIIILNFAAGGFKQPQQILILSHFLSIGQQFDLVVNIDGFNEVALSSINYKYNLDPSMPSHGHIVNLARLASFDNIDDDYLSQYLTIRRDSERIRHLMNFKSKNNFAFVDLFLEVFLRFNFNRFRQMKERLENIDNANLEGSMVDLLEPTGDLEPDDLYQYISQIWLNSSVMMRDLLIPKGANYIHILQPNQYHGGRELVAGEEYAYSENSIFRWGVETGYPVLIERSHELIENNINFFDMSAAFNDIEEIIYSDDCCHYNQFGNEFLGIGIAEKVLAIYKNEIVD